MAHNKVFLWGKTTTHNPDYLYFINQKISEENTKLALTRTIHAQMLSTLFLEDNSRQHLDYCATIQAPNSLSNS